MDTGPGLYSRELDAAIRAARAAEQLIQSKSGEISEQDIRLKGDNDLVTEVDEAAQRIIIRTLREAFPDASFLAEEESDGTKGGDAGMTWIIDPIDGTTNFTRGIPPYAVSIGLREGEDVVLGVILDVAHDELFTAVRGGGVRVNGVPAAVSGTKSLEDSLITTGFPYRAVEHIEQYLEVLGEFMRRTRGVRRPGSAAVDLAYVAAGRFDGFFETGLKAWDVAAGTLMVQEAGGLVTDYRGDPPSIHDEQILATNGLIHEEMRSILQSMRDIRL